MRLDSVRSLKEELLHSFMAPLARPLAARAMAARPSVQLTEASASSPMMLAVSAQPFESVQGVHRAVALGVAHSGRDFKLAVRVQRQQFWQSEVVESIRKRARNEVDVRMIGKVVKRTPIRGPKATGRRMTFKEYIARTWYRGNVRPLLIGASVAHYKVTAGTLGAFVARGGVNYMLSNNHVLADEDRGKVGDAVLQRAPYDGGRRPTDRVAALHHWARLAANRANFIDAALAAIDPKIDFDPTLLRGIVRGSDRRLSGTASDPADIADVVYKVGRTTGVTEGHVTAFDLDNVVVEFDGGNLRFDNQIEIEGAGARAFSDGGDSGSLIVNGKMQAIGLLFAGSESGGGNNRGLTFACPIERVLKDLKATLIAKR